MSDKVFFPRSFIGRTVSFDTPQPSTWKLENKISEKNDQLDAYDVEEIGGISAAYGTFSCRNIDDDNDCAIMKIFMQIPYAGSEFEPPQTRKSQATTDLTADARDELAGLRFLAKKHATFCPILRSWKREKQGDDGFVPGGWMVYLLIRPAPGEVLEEEVFWGFDPTEREVVRGAFRRTYEACFAAGILPLESHIDNLKWDAATKKVYIAAGWHDWRHPEPTDFWSDVEYIDWMLAKPPHHYAYDLETEAHPDMTEWEL